MKARLKKTLSSVQVIVLALSVFCSLLAGTANVALAGVKEVTILDEGQARQHKTFLDTVEALLAELNIVLEEGDKLSHSLQDKLTKKFTIEISRAVNMTVKVDGGELSFKTAEKTVGEALAAEGIVVVSPDETDFVETAPVTEGMCVTVTRVRIAEEHKAFEIPYTTTKRANANLLTGQTKTVQAGQNGCIDEVYRVVYRDQKEVSRELISSETVVNPTEEIIEYGTKTENGVPSRSDLRYTKSLKMNATAYTASSCGKSPSHPAYGITATGTRAARGTVAVDPRVIPLGTRLYIEGYGYAVAADTGGAIKGNRLDLYYDTVSECYNFGRRSVNVYVLE